MLFITRSVDTTPLGLAGTLAMAAISGRKKAIQALLDPAETTLA
jgi:hypothetical protein